MAQTLDQINALRSFKGEEPLTELPAAEATEEQKSEAETNPADAEIKNEAPKDQEESKQAATAAPDLTDDAVKAFLKSKGIQVESFDDLKPKEAAIDPIVAKEQREAAKLSYALNKGLVSKTEYDNFTRDSADPKQLVFAEFHAEAKAANPEATEEEIQDDFMESFNLTAAPGTPKFKAAVKAIAALGQQKLHEKYDKVFQIDTAFEAHENEISSNAAYTKKIVEATPVYKSAVEKVFKELPKFSVPFSDTEVYEVEYPAAMLEEVKGLMLKAETAENQINTGFDEKSIKDAVEMILLKKSFAYQAQKVAEQYLIKNQKGAHGIPDGGLKLPTDTDPFPNMTDDQKKAMSYFTGTAVVGSN